MLRQIIRSTTQMCTRPILANPKCCRSVSMLRASTVNQRSKSIWPIFAGAALSTAFWLSQAWLNTKDRLTAQKDCEKEYYFHLKNTDPKWRQTLTRAKKVGISIGLENPRFKYRFETTDIILCAHVIIVLPKLSSESDFKEVSAFLKTRDILVEPTEHGVRHGLTQFAVEQMNKAVTNHFEKKCYNCPAIESQPKRKSGYSNLHPLLRHKNMT